MNPLDLLVKAQQVLTSEGLTIKHGDHQVTVSYTPTSKALFLGYEGPRGRHSQTTRFGDEARSHKFDQTTRKFDQHDSYPYR